MKLTPTMQACLDFAVAQGGTIKRYPGGFWGQNGMNTQQPWFGTTTIQALVSRGKLQYSEWSKGEHRFPVAASIEIR